MPTVRSVASQAKTYAYVNPVVALFLGWAVAGEPLTSRTLLAAVVIVGAVVLIITNRHEEHPKVAKIGARVEETMEAPAAV
ncbi:MAG: EamA family transporter [Acidobacteria bacterium]|nr:EamA family transporter [Acidobacteriota bacterium]